VLLSAVIGGRAKLVIGHENVSELLTTERTFAEVEEYALILARKSGCPLIYCYSLWRLCL